MKITKKSLKKIKENVWEIPKSFRSDMRVPGRVYASEKLLEEIWKDRSLEQLVNITTLPGVVRHALAMPDVHEGYGCPIGGVVATKMPDGIISPGAIGYDINCGTRILTSSIKYEDIKNDIRQLVEMLFHRIPTGVGSSGKIRLTPDGMKNVLEQGVPFVVSYGYGHKDDIKNCEENGQIKEAKASTVSERAKARGKDQLGTLGSGNHFLEVQRVEQIFDKDSAEKFGLFENQIVFNIHTGSRGLGHQVCTDYVSVMRGAVRKYDIKLPDMELACAPFSSPEGQNYFAAMCAAANFAWVNRQCISHYTRQVWREFLAEINTDKDPDLKLLYDVAHNIAKVEKQIITDQRDDTDNSGKICLNPSKNPFLSALCCVHRKGSTRAFPSQPVLIPGSMGTASYVLVGRQQAMRETFGTVCHGAGRVMSRTQAKRRVKGDELQRELASRGIIAKSKILSGLAEEAPLAYKDIDEVVRVVDSLGLATKVARLVPLGVIKG